MVYLAPPFRPAPTSGWAETRQNCNGLVAVMGASSLDRVEPCAAWLVSWSSFLEHEPVHYHSGNDYGYSLGNGEAGHSVGTQAQDGSVGVGWDRYTELTEERRQAAHRTIKQRTAVALDIK